MMRKAMAAAFLIVSAIPARAQSDHWATDISNASLRFGLPAQWIRMVMNVESGGRPSIDGRPVVSRAGAMGLMQLMPATWAEMRSTLGLGSDPFEPKDNILAGAAYLRMMYDRFGYPGLFAAYNAGPARYSDHLVHGAPLPAETLSYVAKTSGRKPRRHGVGEVRRSRSLFAVGVTAERAPSDTGDNLFAVRAGSAR